MIILVTHKNVIELAKEHLDINAIDENSGRSHELAEKMQMKYMELMDLFWDVEEYSLINYGHPK